MSQSATLPVPRIGGRRVASPTTSESDVLRHRLLLTITLLASLPGAAMAEDEWFKRQFAPAATRPAAPQIRNVSATPTLPQPAMTARTWRTIVIPAQPAARAPQLAVVAPPLKPLTGYAHELKGLASYYWQEQLTSSGERFNRHELTAAHKTLPLGTRVRVTNLNNGASTIVRINDRGPFTPGRVIDLSEAAARQLHMTGTGIARVALDVVN